MGLCPKAPGEGRKGEEEGFSHLQVPQWVVMRVLRGFHFHSGCLGFARILQWVS